MDTKSANYHYMENDMIISANTPTQKIFLLL